MSFPQLRSGNLNPLTQPPQQGPTQYTLSAEAGSYVWTGTDSSLEWNRVVGANSGTYNWTGTDASLEYGKEIDALAGSYTWSGTAADLEYDRRLTAESGSYSWSGTTAALEFDRVLTADTGSYAWTGLDAQLLLDQIDADLSFSGGLRRRNIPRAFHPSHRKPFRFFEENLQAYLLDAEAGSYLWTGTDVSLEWNRLLNAEAGSYVWTGSDVGLFLETSSDRISYSGGLRRRNIPRAFHPSHRKPFRFFQFFEAYLLTAEAGTYDWTGSTAELLFDAAQPLLGYSGGLRRKNYPRAFHPSFSKPTRFTSPQDRVLSAEEGSFGWDVNDAGLIFGQQGSALGGTGSRRRMKPRAFAPGAGALRSRGPFKRSSAVDRTLAADAGAYSWTGTAATLFQSLLDLARQPKRRYAKPRAFAPGVGQLRSAGPFNAQSFAAFSLIAESGTWTWAGTAADLEWSREVLGDSGAYLWTGTAASLLKTSKVVAEAGAYAWTGTAALLEADRLLVALTGSYIVGGQDANLDWSGAEELPEGRRIIRVLGTPLNPIRRHGTQEV